MSTTNTKSLPFFGIPKLLPYIRAYRKTLFRIVLCCLCGTMIDILLPLLQRYALNHFIGENTLDTLPFYILGYVGAGGLGILINEFIGWRDYESLGAVLLALFVVVLIIENTSEYLRKILS